MGKVKAGRERERETGARSWDARPGLASPAGRPGTSAPACWPPASVRRLRAGSRCLLVSEKQKRQGRDAGLLPPSPEVPHLDHANRVPVPFSAGRRNKAENPLLAHAHLSLCGAAPIAPSSASALVLGYRGRAKIFTGSEKSAGKAVKTARRLPGRRVTLGTQPQAPLPGLGCAGRTTGEPGQAHGLNTR